MPTTTRLDEVPPKAQPKIEQIEFMGWNNKNEKSAPGWVFDWEYVIPEDARQRLQVRDMDSYDRPLSAVTELTEAIKRGDIPPPAVLTRDGVLVDGNTTVRAYHKAGGRPTMPAIVIQVDFASASESVRDRLRSLGARLNKHGRSLDADEIARLVLQTHQYDARISAAEIAQRHRVTERVVHNVLAEFRTRQRAAKLGMREINGSVPPTQLRRLGKVSGLNDAPFRELLNLLADAGLTATEFNGLITRVKGTGSDQDALDLLTQERAAREEQIAEYGIREKRRPPQSALLRQRLGFILGFEEGPTALVERSPNFVSEHEEMIARTLVVLAEVLVARPLEVPEHRNIIERAMSLLSEVVAGVPDGAQA